MIANRYIVFAIAVTLILLQQLHLLVQRSNEGDHLRDRGGDDGAGAAAGRRPALSSSLNTSLEQDRTGDPKLTNKLKKLSAPAIPVMALTLTFFAFDLLMSLDPAWFSTIFGVYYFAGGFGAFMALLGLLAKHFGEGGILKGFVRDEHYHDIGKLTFAFVMFWGYIAFSQYILIWYANITEETKFYLTRNTEYWNTFTVAFLVIGHFFIPFGVLLIQQWKKVPVIICSVGVWILLMHFLDLRFMIIPERGPTLTGGEAMSIPGTL